MLKRIAEWIRQHQVLTFFILAYAITWPGLFLVYFIFPGNQVVEVLAFPMVFSPALVAMLISGIAGPLPKHRGGRARWITFVASWILASIVQILYFWKINKIDPTAVIIIM